MEQKFERKENNQIIKITPEGESDIKLVCYGKSVGCNTMKKISADDTLILHCAEQPINAISGEENGTPTNAGKLHVKYSDYIVAMAEHFGFDPTGFHEFEAKFFCDTWEAGNTPVESTETTSES